MENTTMLATSTAVCHGGAIAAGAAGASDGVGSGDSLSVDSTKPLERMVDEHEPNSKDRRCRVIARSKKQRERLLLAL